MQGNRLAILCTGKQTHALNCTKGKGEECRKGEAENDNCRGAVLCRGTALSVDAILEHWYEAEYILSECLGVCPGIAFTLDLALLVLMHLE